MAHWLLAPLDHRAEIWQTYPVQRIVVEAGTSGRRANGLSRSRAACRRRILGLILPSLPANKSHQIPRPDIPKKKAPAETGAVRC